MRNQLVDKCDLFRVVSINTSYSSLSVLNGAFMNSFISSVSYNTCCCEMQSCNFQIEGKQHFAILHYAAGFMECGKLFTLSNQWNVTVPIIPAYTAFMLHTRPETVNGIRSAWIGYLQTGCLGTKHEARKLKCDGTLSRCRSFARPLSLSRLDDAVQDSCWKIDSKTVH